MGAGKFVSNNQRRKGGRMKLEWTTRVASATIVVGLLAVGLIGFLASSNDTSTQSPGGKAITWHSFDEGMALAAKENKKVLVDVYTDWCVWCKKMDKDTYPDEAVRSAIDKHFVAIKLDAESEKTVTFRGQKMTQIAFAQSAGAISYPSTLFLDEKLKPISLLPGYMTPERFSPILLYIGEGHYLTTKFPDSLAKQRNRS